jgi:hypothetical protein
MRTLFSFDPTLQLANMFSLELAAARNSPISPKEFYGGLYLGAHDQFIRYFRRLDMLETVIQQDCELSEPTWAYWIRFFHKHSEGNRQSQGIVTFDDDASAIYDVARRIAAGTLADNIVTLSHIVAATFECRHLKLCDKLVQCGLQTNSIGL